MKKGVWVINKMKISILLIFFCLSSHLFSNDFPSYLEENDVEIFINGFDYILEQKKEAKNNSQTNKSTLAYWDEYDAQKLMIENDKSYGISDFPYIIFERIINYPVPVEIDKIFDNIGWKQNGHKKYWTIYHYFTNIKIIKDYEDPDSEVRRTWRWVDLTGRLTEFQYGLEKQEHNIEQLRIEESKKANSTLYERLNRNDLDIILSNWDKLSVIFNKI